MKEFSISLTRRIKINNKKWLAPKCKPFCLTYCNCRCFKDCAGAVSVGYGNGVACAEDYSLFTVPCLDAIISIGGIKSDVINGVAADYGFLLDCYLAAYGFCSSVNGLFILLGLCGSFNSVCFVFKLLCNVVSVNVGINLVLLKVLNIFCKAVGKAFACCADVIVLLNVDECILLNDIGIVLEGEEVGGLAADVEKKREGCGVTLFLYSALSGVLS